MKTIRNTQTFTIDKQELIELIKEHYQHYSEATNLHSQRNIAPHEIRFAYNYADDEYIFSPNIFADFINFKIEYINDKPVKLIERIQDRHIIHTVIYKIDRRRRG